MEAVFIGKLFMACAVTAIAELDRIAIFHTLLYEPIVLSGILGWMLGEPALGLKIGAIMELIFLGSFSLGGSLPLDPTLPSAAAVFAAAMNEHIARAHLQAPIEQNVLIAIAITIAIPLASVGRIVERRVKEMNVDPAPKG